jgi:aldehyde dehydrogenase (NAD+)
MLELLFMYADLFRRLGLADENSGVCAEDWIAQPQGKEIVALNPATGQPLARVRTAASHDYEACVLASQRAFQQWRKVPAPQRGQFVRMFGDALRLQQADLGALVSLEAGKIRSEGLGEVREMIDMCDFAVGLSRQMYGLTIASERAEHSLLEQWHPLGIVGIITSFNFPVAVWAWNAMLAAVCGDTCLWKPSSLTPLCAIAVHKLAQRVMREMGLPPLFQLCIGDRELGATLAADTRIPLVSATGSCRMGRSVAATVGQRLGRSLLELGGNNAAILTPSADVDVALRAVAFAAVGTAGQRCTTLRRLFIHRSLCDAFVTRLVNVYRSISIGDPWQDNVLVGPLIRASAVENMQAALAQAVREGGKILVGGQPVPRPGYFVEPAIVLSERDLPIASEETFAPILYVSPYDDFAEAIARQNQVEQGLSSSLFSNNLTEAFRFLSVEGSDCGIANVNIGTSGAEIGGAFGGEKSTGGGREAGSDAWKAYMRRQTCTVNYGRALPLAQGVKFEIQEN